MSVKFEKETVKQAQTVISGAEGGHIPGTSGKHPLAEAVGTALTGGSDNAGVKGYLAVSCSNLDSATGQGRGLLIDMSRHTSRNSKRILSEPRCSQQARWLVRKNSLHRG